MERPHRVRSPLVVMLVLAAVALTSCAGILNVIEDRLPPPHEVAGGMLFSYQAPSARRVQLAGNFNSWVGTQGGGRIAPDIDPMTDPDGDGIWTIVKPLPPGRYQYKFVIDDGIRWERDPNNPDTAWEGGFENSLIVVPGTVSYGYETVTGTVIGEARRAFDVRTAGEAEEAEPVQVTLEVRFPDAQRVYLAGTFNEWNPTGIPLTKGENDLFSATIELKPGTYQYKYVVDGAWVEDPDNPETIDDGYGGVNSVLTVE